MSLCSVAFLSRASIRRAIVQAMKTVARPRWLQIHLSTIVVVTLIAGVLVGLNALPKKRAEVHLLHTMSDSPGSYTVKSDRYISYGWPWSFYSDEPSAKFGSFSYSRNMTLDSQQMIEWNMLKRDTIDYGDLCRLAPSLSNVVTFSTPHFEWNVEAVTADIVVAIGILIATAIACERSASRKSNPHSAIRNPQ